MIILSIVATIGMGIYLDGYVIHPPAHYTGICPPPAHISNNGQNCTIPQVSEVTSGTVTKETTIQVPAGTVIVPNGTSTKTVTTTVTG